MIDFRLAACVAAFACLSCSSPGRNPGPRSDGGGGGKEQDLRIPE